jgi:hypothetical protein
MRSKYAVVFAAILSVALPTVAHATGSRIDREEHKAKKQEVAIWSYELDGKTIGPMTKSSLIKAAKDGIIVATTKIHTPDDGWRLASEVPELEYALN